MQKNNTMNTIIERINKERLNYCHAVEVSDVYELQIIVEELCNDFRNEEESEIIDFFQTISLYCLDDQNEEEVYNFDIINYVKELI